MSFTSLGHTSVFFRIANGIDYPRAIGKELKITGQTVSERIAFLVKHDLIKTAKRDIAQHYELDWRGIFKVWFDEYASALKLTEADKGKLKRIWKDESVRDSLKDILLESEEYRPDYSLKDVFTTGTIEFVYCFDAAFRDEGKAGLDPFVEWYQLQLNAQSKRFTLPKAKK